MYVFLNPKLETRAYFAFLVEKTMLQGTTAGGLPTNRWDGIRLAPLTIRQFDAVTSGTNRGIDPVLYHSHEQKLPIQYEAYAKLSKDVAKD